MPKENISDWIDQELDKKDAGVDEHALEIFKDKKVLEAPEDVQVFIDIGQRAFDRIRETVGDMDKETGEN